ncbi:TolC family protein [Pedobacter antarcticus]|uniref:Transporter n=2 Tax=Pedobacter antarcticus TaxID=34086 RepID=A0A081PGZ5_9SPHI|nr:TolC family protein [Pedobacter antarcticus]KEQ29968.1 transporter [Pedobacter antarcticus 4BY]SDM04370.1 outer membrane protein [Pedobacter antarcticus]SFF28340.1 outer membrane protein [Pedobacter antarcticus]
MKTFTPKSLRGPVTFSMTLLVAALGFSGTAAAQEKLTIQQAVERMLQNNLTIKQAALNVSTSEVNLQQSKAALYPSLNGGLDNSLNFGRSLNTATNQLVSNKFYQGTGSLNASVDLFGGFAKLNQIRQNKILLEAGNSNLDKIKNDLTLQVVTAYFQVVFNEDLLKASNEQLIVAQETEVREQALLEAGNKTLADISQAKAQAATAELNVTNAQNQLTISFLTLSQLMEMRPDSSNYEVVAPTIVDIAMARKNYNVNEVYNSSLAIFPDIKLAKLNREAAEKGVAVAKGALSPRISLGGGIGSRYSYLLGTGLMGSIPNPHLFDQISNNFFQNVGLSVQIPIFNGLQARSNVKRAKINYEDFKIQEQLAKNNLNKVIAQAVADLRAADSRYKSNENTFNAQKDAFNVIEQRYNVGLVNSLDYNTSRTNRNKAEIDLIQAKYDLLFRSKVIDYYLGNQITF